jgi:hypothetical protein
MKATIAFKLDNTVDTAMSEAFEIPDWAKECSLQIPTIVTGTVGFQFMKEADVTAAKIVADQNTDWVNVVVAIDSVGNLTIGYDGTGAVVVQMGAFMRGLGKGMLRVVCGGVQNAVTTWYAHFAG